MEHSRYFFFLANGAGAMNSYYRELLSLQTRGDQQPEPEQEPDPEFDYFGRSRSRTRSFNYIKKPDQEPDPESVCYGCHFLSE